MAHDQQQSGERQPDRQSVTQRMAARVQPGSGLQFLVAVIAVLIVGVIIAVAVHLAMPNDDSSNDPNRLPDNSQLFHLPAYDR